MSVATEKLFKLIYSNPALLSNYEAALDSMKASVVLDFLKAKIDEYSMREVSDVSLSGLRAAKIGGYIEALDDIINFKDKYIMPQEALNKISRPTYGGTKLAVEQGYMTEDEAKKLEEDRRKSGK